MKLMKVQLYSYFKDNEIECCCPPKNKCSKDKGCELLDFTLDPYADIKECMKHSSYKRNKGAIKQK